VSVDPQPGQGYPPPPGQAYPMPPGDGYPPPPGGYPPPEQKQGFSGLAIAGFILAFIIPLVGFILSLVAIFQTGKGKQRGRGLAIAGVIIPVVLVAGIVGIVIAVSQSTVADPGCTSGKDAIFKIGENPTPATMETVIADLNAAADKAKNDDVRTAMKTLADDYAKMMADAKEGKAPTDATLQKIGADGDAIDNLCTIGS
jgi:hypothetical protein